MDAQPAELLHASALTEPCHLVDGPSAGRFAAVLCLDPTASAMTDTALLARLDALAVPMLRIVGPDDADPLAQQASLAPLLRALGARRMRVEMRTTGAIRPLGIVWPFVDAWDVQVDLRTATRPALRQLQMTGNAVFTFAPADTVELRACADLVRDCALTNIWLAGGDPRVSAAARAHGWNLAR